MNQLKIYKNSTICCFHNLQIHARGDIFSHISSFFIILALRHDMKNNFEWYHNKPYITYLWIIIPPGRTRILSYNLDNSLLDLLFWWRIWTRRPRPLEQRRCVIAPSASARQRFCFSSSTIEDAPSHYIWYPHKSIKFNPYLSKWWFSTLRDQHFHYCQCTAMSC